MHRVHRPVGVDQRRSAPALGGGDGRETPRSRGRGTPRPAARSDPPRRRAPRSRRAARSAGTSSTRVRSGARPSSPVSAAIMPRRRALAVALIGHGGIGEPVAHHPHAGRQRRADGPLDMLGAGGEMQQRLGRRRPVDRAAQQQVAQQLRPPARRPARACAAPAGRAAASASASSRAWVDLPAPSPPSSVMNRPGRAARRGVIASAAGHVARDTAIARPGRPSCGTSAPASSGTSIAGTPCPATVSLPSVVPFATGARIGAS